MAGRAWTSREDDLMHQHYGRVPHTELCRLLPGRTRAATQMRAKLLGLTEGTRPLHGNDAARQRIALLSRAGWSDQEIASELGLTRENVRYHRQRMGLSGNKNHPRQKARAREEGLRGKTNLIPWRDVMRQDADLFARESGWPLGLRLRQVQMLNLLAATGRPMTRQELCEGVGLSRQPDSGPARCGSVDRRPGYVSELVMMGLVSRLVAMGPHWKGQEKGRRMDLFTLGPEALRLLIERVRARAGHACQEGEAAGADRTPTAERGHEDERE